MSQQRRLVLGIDGGGTHTRAALLDDAGRVLGIGNAGASNYQSVGIENARENIRAAVAGAYRTAGLAQRPAAAAFLGMAGVASPADRAAIEAIACQLDLAATLGIDHDIRTALVGGLAGEEGIALIAGTGSSCYGRKRDGQWWRSGGWGGLLDDGGSGYWLGLQGLVAITRAADARAEPTMLSVLLMRALGLEDINDILRVIEHKRHSRMEIAALAPLVLHAWNDGDRSATAIVERGADELGLMATAVAAQLGWKDRPHAIVTIGGLFADNRYRECVGLAITSHLPHASVIEPMMPPSIGAGILALELAGVPIDGMTMERIGTSLREFPASR